MVVVELERQEDLADEIDYGPLIYGSGHVTGGFKSLVFRMLDEDAILAIPGERKSDGGSAFLDVVDGDESAGRIGADGNGSFHAAGEG